MAMNVYWTATGQHGLAVSTEVTKFNEFIGRFMRRLSDKDAGIFLLRLAFSCVRSFILKNPVLTGRSRAGWFVAAENLASLGGSSYRANVSSYEQDEGYAAGKFKASLTGSNKWVEITNAVKYIIPLEYGWSTKAPYGMVRITFQMIRKEIPDTVMTMLRSMWDREQVPRWADFRSSADGPISMGPVAAQARRASRAASRAARRGRR